MILDDFLEFADAVSVVGATGTALIGDVVDTIVHRDIGSGQPLFLVVTVDTSVITAGAAGTIQFQLVSDAQPAIAVDGSATVHVSSGPLVTGVIGSTSPKLKAGQLAFSVALPMEGPVYERYVGILAVVGTTATSAGKINAFLTLDPTAWQDYPKAVS